MGRTEEAIRSIKQVIPVWDRAHAKLRRELIERARMGEDVYAYRSIGGTRNVWVNGRRHGVNGNDGEDVA